MVARNLQPEQEALADQEVKMEEPNLEMASVVLEVPLEEEVEQTKMMEAVMVQPEAVGL